MRIVGILASALTLSQPSPPKSPPIVSTTSGHLVGQESDGVRSFLGIRYAESPTGELRWAPPVAVCSNAIVKATALGPSCIQQFAFSSAQFTVPLFNDPPLTEDEDCLYLNVWEPASVKASDKKPVVVWIHGGSFAFGSASYPEYDGRAFAKNQDVVFVSLNYRMNIFGFPTASDLLVQRNNLGFLDQELALQWVQDNIAHFGGDKKKVTLMGQSAGSISVTAAIARHNTSTAPFRAGILMSSADTTRSTAINYAAFDDFARAVNCTQPPQARLPCLRNVSAAAIRNFTNGPTSGTFTRIVDNATLYYNALDRIRRKQAARVPILAGSLENDGTVFTFGASNLSLLPVLSDYPNAPSPSALRAVYPAGLNDSQILAAADTDGGFKCPAAVWSDVSVTSGMHDVYRYMYGAVFADNSPAPGLGAWHTSELPALFGTYNASTATPAEKTLSRSFQTAFANFVKDPSSPPARNWPKYVPGNKTQTLAKIAYDGNVEPGNFVVPVQSDLYDGPCTALWNSILDARS